MNQTVSLGGEGAWRRAEPEGERGRGEGEREKRGERGREAPVTRPKRARDPGMSGSDRAGMGARYAHVEGELRSVRAWGSQVEGEIRAR